MEINILYHSFKDNKDCENNIRNIAILANMPEYLSIYFSLLGSISIMPGTMSIYVTELPARIDYDGYLADLFILTFDQIEYYQKPRCLLSTKRDKAVTLWEYGERELANIEEGCLLPV